MDSIVIQGGKRLEGKVRISGAKNAALPILASSLLAEGTSTFRNVPELADIATMGKLLRSMGCSFERGEGARSDEVRVRVPSEDLEPIAPYELVKTMRASVLVLGPLVASYGKARVSLPGGCAIGARPIDQHLKGLEQLGATISLEHGYVQAKAKGKRLVGDRFTFDVVSVTGTENLLMAACLAKGTTVLENAAREPEVEDLADALIGMGAKIEGAGTDRIEVEGVESLRPADHSIIADRIEAGTFLVAAAITGGDVTLEGCIPRHLDVVIEKLREAGAKIEEVPEGLRVRGPKRLRAVDVKTQPFPGFPTDMQAQLMVAMVTAKGSSVITENVFENRFMHVQELSRMGASIAVDGKTAVVKGVDRLSGAPVMATDLRASASLILAGLCAAGTTTVQRVYHLDRGYQRIEQKLRGLGADVRRLKNS